METESCCDKLKFYKVDDNNVKRIFRLISGSLQNVNVLLPNNPIYVTFTSDHSVTDEGFSAAVQKGNVHMLFLFMILNIVERRLLD